MRPKRRKNERLYSITLSEKEYGLYLEFQKEFGLLQDISQHGLKRSSLKKLNHLRHYAADKVLESMVKDGKKIENLNNQILNSKKVPRNKKVRSGIYREINKRSGGHISVSGLPQEFTGSPSSMYIPLKDANIPEIVPVDVVKDAIKYTTTGKERTAFRKLAKRGKKLNKKWEKGKMSGIISHEVKAGDDSLAHEFGHYLNTVGTKSERKISRQGGKLNRVRRLTSNEERILDAKPTIKNTLATRKTGKVMVQEETNASEKALDLLKRNGATKEELDLAKKNLDLATETYKLSSKAATKAHLYKYLRPKRGNIKSATKNDVNRIKEKLGLKNP